jgi:hypothetical protein
VSTSGTTVESTLETKFEAVNGTVRVNGETAGPLRIETQSVAVTDGDDGATTATQGPGLTLLQAGVGAAILAVVGWTWRASDTIGAAESAYGRAIRTGCVVDFYSHRPTVRYGS